MSDKLTINPDPDAKTARKIVKAVAKALGYEDKAPDAGDNTVSELENKTTALEKATALEKSTEEGGETTDQAAQEQVRATRPDKSRIFVYVGAPIRDEIEDGPEIEASREHLQKLAMEELRRKREKPEHQKKAEGEKGGGEASDTKTEADEEAPTAPKQDRERSGELLSGISSGGGVEKGESDPPTQRG
jgi:hypothetical protein